MFILENKTKEIHGVRPDAIPEEVLSSAVPLILKGLVKNWPIVQAGLQSDEEADSYLRSFYNGKAVGAFIGDSEIGGRFFYDKDMTGFNFESRRVPLDSILDQIRQHKGDPKPPAFYVGSATVDTWLPGFRTQNDLKLNDHNLLTSIWIGNQSRIACHYDAPSNIACSVVGQRRFTLFPPDQIGNLYPGPIDFTPAGQAVSMVDFANPDLEAFPNFRRAMSAGEQAELVPGDALYIPSMWWHHVEGLAPFNVLVNYWWRTVPSFMGPAVNVLNHALLSIRDLPESEKAAWKNIFDYYVFGAAEQAGHHIPEHARGALSPMDDIRSRRLRALLINKLNR